MNLTQTHAAGEVLKLAIESSSAESLMDLLHKTVPAGLRYAASQSRLRQIIEIAARSSSARQAHHSRMMEVEDTLAQAYAARLRKASGNAIRPCIFAGITLSAMSAAMVSWFTGEHKTLAASAKQVFSDLARALRQDEIRASRSGSEQASR